MPKARDLMETHVISVDPETALLDVHRLFREEQISGAPVVDDERRLIGVITSTDLLRATEEERDTVVVETAYFRDVLPYSSPDWDCAPVDFQDRLAERRVSEAMTRGVISVSPDASAADVARILHESQIHRLFVVEAGRLRGVISAFDLLRLVEDMKD